MLPPLEGIIARRVLLNFRADPTVVQRWIPQPLQVATQNGYAVVGVCLIRLECLRPKGLPAGLGMASENMAHRVAVRFPTPDGVREGVYVWRRDTDRTLVALLGGRLFPGVHRLAAFQVAEGNGCLGVSVLTENRRADVSFDSGYPGRWRGTPLFGDMDEASQFFERGDCGFSSRLRGGGLEGMWLRSLRWDMIPLFVRRVRTAFFEDPERFPRGSVEFDCALLMRGIPHDWHPLSDVPGLESVAAGKRR